MKDLITNSMPKVQQISFRSAQAAEKGLKEEWLSLFDEDAIIQDPVGKSPLDPTGDGHRGIKAIEAFWDSTIGPGDIKFTVRESYPCENECANVATVINRFEDGGKLDTDLVIVYKINNKNKLISIKAYWEYQADN